MAALCCSAGWNGATLESYLKRLRAHVVEAPNIRDELEDQRNVVVDNGSSNRAVLARVIYGIFRHLQGGSRGLVLLSCGEIVKSRVAAGPEPFMYSIFELKPSAPVVRHDNNFR